MVAQTQKLAIIHFTVNIVGFYFFILAATICSRKIRLRAQHIVMFHVLYAIVVHCQIMFVWRRFSRVCCLGQSVGLHHYAS